jgi:hypothetical protein
LRVGKTRSPLSSIDNVKPESTAGGRGQVILAVYTACVFASALLLFLVEPMVAKMLLPLVGGAPAVWTTSLFFFQALLLAGYGYSHLVATRFSPRQQAVSHTCLLGLAIAVLPINFASVGTPTPGTSPVAWQLAVMLLRVGLPFFCLSTLSPLLQSWFSRTGHAHAGDPYFLYLASNIGGLGALVAYPVAIERFSGLEFQARAWMVGYVLLIALVTVTTVHLWWTSGHVAATAKAQEAPREPIAPTRVIRWVALAAVPSLWMLGLTAYFTTLIRPIPLLWVVPLALYLLSFAVVFARRPIPVLRLAPAYPFFAVAVLGIVLLGGERLPFLWAAIIHFSAFLLGALLCHGRLAADRPAPRGLTVFYLALAVGGALGGLVGAIVAPVLLRDLYEYPLAIVAGGLMLPTILPVARRHLSVDVGLPVLAAAALLAVGIAVVFAGIPDRLAAYRLTESGTAADLLRLCIAVPLPALGAVAFSRRPLGLGIMLATIFGLSLLPLGSDPVPLYQSRDFFGVHKVVATSGDALHVYKNGGVTHGIQAQEPSLKDVPTSYYEPTGPVGDVFRRWVPATASVGVVGLGAGDMACYRGPSQTWTFYEIDPDVVRIARDPRLFTYLHDCARDDPLVLGDGRLELSHAPDRSYDLIAVDAFSGDAPPVHLLTREALAMYMAKLRPGGMLLFNISNSYVDFRAVLSATGQSLGLTAYDRVDAEITPAEAAKGKLASEWMILAPGSADAPSLARAPGWTRLSSSSASVWTDDYSNLLSVLRLF